MATINVKVMSCDKCGSTEEGTSAYTIEGGGQIARMDLCLEHAAPLLDLLKLGSTIQPTQGRPGGRGGTRRTARWEQYVSTIPEIAKQVEKERKARAKAAASR